MATQEVKISEGNNGGYPMTEDELRAIEARCDAATPMPWNKGYPCEHDKATHDFALQARTDIPRLVAEVWRIRGALESIEEYWNRDQNEKAMADACWHAIETAKAALEGREG